MTSQVRRRRPATAPTDVPPERSASRCSRSRREKTVKKNVAKSAARSATRPSTAARPLGAIAFVGTGPGDPGLLTVRAAELIQSADIVITETRAHRSMLADLLGNRLDEVTVIDGGYGDDGEPLTYASRSKLIVKQAKSGGNVVRLVSGDPWLYSTGPEEAVACAKARVSIELVPGVSDVTAVPAYAGVPLTTRENRDLFIVNLTDASVDWTATEGVATLVLVGSVSSVVEAANDLAAQGRDEDTPIAVTRVGTTTDQVTVVSTLGEIDRDVRLGKLTGSSVAVVGEVVDLRSSLSWFETKPLFGWRVLVPRTKDQAGPLSARLRRFGAVPEEVPTISVEPPRNPRQMDKAVRGLVEGRYEWIAFTSVNAVRAIREKFDEYGLDARAFSGLKVAAVGDRTAQAMIQWGIRPDLIPSGEQSARGLLEDWPPYDKVLDPINRVFLPRADIATETLVAGLVDLGWEVDDVTAYRTVRAAPPPASVRDAIKTGRFDAVVFTSSSTVRNLVGIAGKPHGSTIVAAIGPATAKTCEEHGLRVDVLASTPSVGVLADELAAFGAARRAAMIDEGAPVTKPSQRRAPVRRRAT
jgi:uroporphyrinogen III methyltransferase / synthase